MSFRKRGWSMEEDHKSKRQRPRANTDHSEDTLTAAEKQELLNSFPVDELDKASHHDDNGVGGGGDGGKDEDMIEMFGADSDSDASDSRQPAKKRRKVNVDSVDDTDVADVAAAAAAAAAAKTEADAKNQKLLQQAKGRLSKWAARLFDPDRPRGLVEAPEVIPLNDEFLSSFGKREKEFDNATGKKVEFDDDDLDNMDGILSENEGEGDDDKGKSGAKKSGKGTKLKISNLSFNTTEKSLTKLCEKYGALNNVHLLMDDKQPTRSRGRAYVVFESKEDAESFMKNMNDKSYEGRSLRVGLVTEQRRDSMGGKKVGAARYWVKDITTKCFHCGGVGHMASSCPNEAQEKPCPLCAKTGHDSWSCPLSRICFNCGVPGHINNKCPERRGMPRRIVCGACFVSGHHRWECEERIQDIPSYGAKCLVCGEDGHFMCDDMKWFFGLKGISCFNCGRSGHHGSDCDRPNCDLLLRDADLSARELERAEAKSLEDELEEQRQKSRDKDKSRNRGRSRDKNDDNGRNGRGGRGRAKSQPASRFRPQNQASNYGRIQDSSRGGRGGRDEPRGPSSNSRGRVSGGSGRDQSYNGRNNSSRGGGRRTSSGSSRGYR